MPEEIRRSMELQMTAERQKRARVLESEAIRQSKINESEGQKQAQINLSEAMQIDRVHRARGESEAIQILAEATAHGIERIAEALSHSGGEKAASLQIAEKYMEAFRHLAKEGNTIVLPSHLHNPAAMIAEAMSIYEHVKKKPLQDSVAGSLLRELQN